MSLIVGLSTLFGLLAFTWVLTILLPYTKDYPMALVGIMIFGDFLVAGTFYLVGMEFVTDVDKFKMGIGLAFMMISFSRALIFLVNAKKKGYL
jgi:hypothetical protein